MTNLLKRFQNLFVNTSLALALGLTLAITPAEAKIYTHPTGGIQFDAPNDWIATPEEDILVLTPKGGGVSVTFWVLGEDDMEEAIGALYKELSNKMPEFESKHEEAQTTTLNGMEVVYDEGTAEIDGIPSEWSLAIIIAAKPVVVLTVGSEEAMAKYSSVGEKLVRSIKRAE